MWNEFSNLKKEEVEKETVSGDPSKPNPRFDRQSKSDDVITSEERAIKAKVKELDKAISIDEEDITMGDSRLVKNKIGFDEPQNQKMKDEGTIVIQFGTLPEQIEVNTTTFTLPKTFEAKEEQHLVMQKFRLQRKVILM